MTEGKRYGSLQEWLDDLPEREAARALPIEDLIERSSLGTPEAQAARASVPDDVARLVVEMSQLPDTQGCTEWTCIYHGETNREMARLKRELHETWQQASNNGGTDD